MTESRKTVHLMAIGDPADPNNGSAIQTVIMKLHESALEENHLSSIAGTHGKISRPAVQPIWHEIPKLLRYFGKFPAAVTGFDPSVAVAGRSLRKLQTTNPRTPLDVICHNQPWIGSWRSVLFRRGDRLVLYMHNRIMHKVPRRIARRVLRKFDQIICVSHNLATWAKHEFDLPEQLISVVHNGAPEVASRSSEATIDVLFVGRLTPEKGVEVLIDALVLLAAKGCLPKVSIVGGAWFYGNEVNSYELNLRRLVREHGLNVAFEGVKTPAEVLSYRQTARICVVPSTWEEPCPLTVLEGLAAGNVVIASAIGGIPEIVEDAGILFPVGDAAECARAIQAVLSSSEMQQRLSSNGYRAAQKRNWSSCYQDLRDVLRKTEPQYG